jgi:hypothetical protein
MDPNSRRIGRETSKQLKSASLLHPHHGNWCLDAGKANGFGWLSIYQPLRRFFLLFNGRFNGNIKKKNALHKLIFMQEAYQNNSLSSQDLAMNRVDLQHYAKMKARDITKMLDNDLTKLEQDFDKVATLYKAAHPISFKIKSNPWASTLFNIGRMAMTLAIYGTIVVGILALSGITFGAPIAALLGAFGGIALTNVVLACIITAGVTIPGTALAIQINNNNKSSQQPPVNPDQPGAQS